MRTIISLFLISITSVSIAQRIEFNDPDLSFSIKKPKDWQVFDNGYLIKISPAFKDTSTTYLTITYYEDAAPIGGGPTLEIMQPREYIVTELPTPNEVKIGKYQLKTGTTQAFVDEKSYAQQRYLFNHYGQRWEIITSCPEDKKEEYMTAFNRIIKSIQIKQE